MNALSNLWQKLNRSKRYRESFPAAVVKRMLPLQIRVLRKQRGWSQAQLAQESKLTQGVISRAEDPDYGNLTVNTLVRIGAGFDCAFVGRFVPFSELAKWYISVTDEKTLEVPSFLEDREFGVVEHKGTQSEWLLDRSTTMGAEIPSESFPGIIHTGNLTDVATRVFIGGQIFPAKTLATFGAAEPWQVKFGHASVVGRDVVSPNVYLKTEGFEFTQEELVA